MKKLTSIYRKLKSAVGKSDLPKIFHKTLVPRGGGWPIKISVLFFVTFCIVMPLACFRLKYSPYNRWFKTYRDKESLLKENDERLLASDKYFSSLAAGSRHDTFIPRSKSPNEPVDIHILVLTLSRNRIAMKLDRYQPKYLTQSVWRFSTLTKEAISQGFPYSIKISACNVDPDPGTYHEANHLSQYVNVNNRFNKTYNADKHPKEKEKDDYVYCLQEGLKSSSKYTLLVEDDGYPIDDFFPVLQRTMDRYLEKVYARGEYFERTEEVLFVKFFHAEWVQGFIDLHRERLPELLALGLLFGTALTVLLDKYYFIEGVHVRTLWAVMMVYAMLIAALMGRVNVTEYRRWASPHLYSYVSPAPACCIPGVLYTREGATHIIDYLSSVTCTDDLPKDMAIGRYVYQSGKRAYQVQPNTFLHIGAYSLVREKFDPTRV